MQADERMPFTSRINQSRGYKIPRQLYLYIQEKELCWRNMNNMGKVRPTHWDCSWPRHQYEITNKNTNGDTISNPQSRDNWQTHVQGPNLQHKPRQAKIIQEQGFKVAYIRCYHQQHGCCIEDIRDPKQNRGSRPGKSGTSTDYPHQQWKDESWRLIEELLRQEGRYKKHRGKAFSIIIGQWQKVLIYKMKSDPEWEIS